jgi:hypothetical protein
VAARLSDSHCVNAAAVQPRWETSSTALSMPATEARRE